MSTLREKVVQELIIIAIAIAIVGTIWLILEWVCILLYGGVYIYENNVFIAGFELLLFFICLIGLILLVNLLTKVKMNEFPDPVKARY